MAESKVSSYPSMKKPQSQIHRLKKLEEDEHWISEEELYTEGSSDEEKGTHSARKHRDKETRRSRKTEKSRSPAPEFKPPTGDLTGMNYEEITKSEKTLSEMRSKIRKLKKTLRDPNAVSEFHDINKVREEIRRKREPVKVSGSSETIEAGFSEVQKLDECLRKKTEEEKSVKFSRMQEEEENCEILTELMSGDASECIKINSEQFLRLASGWEPISTTESLESLSNSTDGQVAENVKKERPVKRKRRNGVFIERNIQLAKCGNGVLSLTDEEKIRIENLLKEPDLKAEEPSDSSNGPADLNSSFSSVCSENLYVLSDEAKELLEDIDRKLKEYSKLKLPDPENSNPISKFKSAESDTSSESKEAESSNSNSNSEQEKPAKKTKKNCRRKFIPLKNEGYRLREVDKLIEIINSVSNEEISPLCEEDIKTLIEKVKLSLDVIPPENTERTETTENESKAESQSSGISMPMPSPGTVSELVNAAKCQMPNFKYRYANS